MKTILYIDQNQIQAMKIRGKKKEYLSVPLQLGTVVNGVILDSENLKNALKQLNLKTKKVTLVIDSSNILSKKLTLPKASKRKLHNMVKGEFGLFHNEHNYQYDLNILSSAPSVTAMGYAVSEDIIDAYHHVCKDCGLEVERVGFVINGLINYLVKKPEFQEKTFLFNVISGDHMLSLLFENDKYMLSNRIRLLHVGEGELFYQELYSRLSTMLQFSSSERSAHAIAESYYIGISPEDVSKLEQYVDEILPVKVKSYQDETINMDYFLPALAIHKNKHDINLAIKHTEVAARSHKRHVAVSKVAILLLLLGAGAAHSLLIFQDYKYASNKLDEAKAIATKAETLEKLGIYNDLLDENDQLNYDTLKYKTLFSLLESGAVVEKPVMEQIFDNSNIENFSFDFKTGAVYIHGTFPSNAEATDYAAKLREKGFFVEMNYDGYYKDAESKKDNSLYHFIISASYEPIEESYSEEDLSK